MKNVKQESKQEIQIKQQQLSTTQKIIQFFTSLFLWQKNVERSISVSLVATTYFQFMEIIFVVLQLSYFKSTNNSTYTAIMCAVSGLFFVLYFLPRISKKHVIFQVFLIVYAIFTIAYGLFQLILYENYQIFTFYCNQIKNYYFKKQITTYSSQNICQSISNIYQIQLISAFVLLFLRFVYMGLIFRAYLSAKQKYQAQEKNRRRKQKYDELLLKRSTYNQKRKV